ncbi:MAG: phosphotriesterase [Candidatus Limnocylindria bacterium]
MSDGPVAMTVTGPVDPATLGVTLMHEHVWMDTTPVLAVHGYPADADGPFDAERAAEARWNPGSHPDNYRLTDEDTAVAELAHVAAAGGATVVDVTPIGLGRDPRALAAIARRTGLRIVMGGGYYLGPVHPPGLADRSEAAIADAMIEEAWSGVDGSGIRPGIIGELGTSDPPRPEELRVLRAAAVASRATGLALSVHLHPWGRTGELVADTLLEAGADPARVILGHLTTAHDDAPYLRRLASRGTTLAFDLFGFDHSLLGPGRYPPSDADVAATVVRLVREEGLGDRILLSQDVGVRTRLRRYGGWGYDHLLRHVVPLLHSGGLDGPAVTRLLVDGPRRLLTIAEAAAA